MSVAKKIRMILVEREMTLKDLSAKLGKSPSTVSNKMTRDNFSEEDIKEIAEVLNFDYEILFRDKETGKTF